jgi:hypothetical protein
MATKLRLEDPNPPDTDTTAAQTAVSAFETVPEGQAYANEDASATEAVDVVKAGARMTLCPASVLMTADVVTAFMFHEELFERSRYAERCANLHQQCLAAMPALAAFLRSGPVLARVAAAAVASAPASGTQADVAARAVEQYQRTIARQLIGRPEFEPAASVLSVVVPELEARVEACRTRHEAHVKAELDRMEREKRDAAEVIAADEAQQRETLAGFFGARHSRGFAIHGELFSGGALAQAARRIGVQNDGGYYEKFSLAELQALRDRETAGDAAMQGGGVL